MSAQSPTGFPIQAPYPQFRYHEALETARADIAAVTVLRKVNLDVPSAVLTVLGALPRLKGLRAELAALPGFDGAAFDALETYALAAGHAHVQFQASSEPPEPIPVMVEELTKTRALFEDDVRVLANRGLMSADRLRELKGSTGHKALAFDVMLLCALLRGSWSQISARTGVTESDLLRAENVADRLATALALKETKTEGGTAAADLRQRAFTLLVQTYNEARRAVTYVRWHEDDADDLAPSLYTKGTRRRAPEEEEPAPAVPPLAPAAGGSPVPGAGAPTPVVGTGLPGSEPFVR